jgi:hypothetical protein
LLSRLASFAASAAALNAAFADFTAFVVFAIVNLFTSGLGAPEFRGLLGRPQYRPNQFFTLRNNSLDYSRSTGEA